jgi:ferritin
MGLFFSFVTHNPNEGDVMIKEKVEAAINDQINFELHSSYLYYAMASYFSSMSLNGFAKWMRIQALEEIAHAQKFVGFLEDKGGTPTFGAIDAPQTTWESPLAAFEAAYNHECLVTTRINALMDTALDERDHSAISFLNWFIDEQVEEEATAGDVVQKLKMVEKTEGGIFMLDLEMNKRSFTAPADLAGVV